MCGAIFDDLAARLGDVAQCHAPDLPGQGTFQGSTFHTGKWPHEPVSFAGQTVAVCL